MTLREVVAGGIRSAGMPRARESKPVGENQSVEMQARWGFVAQQRRRTEVRAAVRFTNSRTTSNSKPRSTAARFDEPEPSATDSKTWRQKPHPSRSEGWGTRSR